jgi:hypothetical protein
MKKSPANCRGFLLSERIYLLPFFGLFGACVRADPATLLPVAEVFSLLSCFEAFEATSGDVCSEAAFLAMSNDVKGDTLQSTSAD